VDILTQTAVAEQNVEQLATVRKKIYSIDGQSKSLAKEFYKWCKTYYAFTRSLIQHIKVQLVTDTSRILESFFIHKKPLSEVLTQIEII